MRPRRDADASELLIPHVVTTEYWKLHKNRTWYSTAWCHRSYLDADVRQKYTRVCSHRWLWFPTEVIAKSRCVLQQKWIRTTYKISDEHLADLGLVNPDRDYQKTSLRHLRFSRTKNNISRSENADFVCVVSSSIFLFSSCHPRPDRHIDHLTPSIPTFGILWRRSETFFYSDYALVCMIFLWKSLRHERVLSQEKVSLRILLLENRREHSVSERLDIQMDATEVICVDV